MTSPRDIVYVPGWVSNIEVMWEDPGLARYLCRLSSFARVITFDKRGTGLSDPIPLDALPDLESRMDDLRAVMDEVGSERATLFGHSDGANLCLLFVATHPDRTAGLILTGAFAKRVRSADYPWAPTREEGDALIAEVERDWGQSDNVDLMASSRADDPGFRRISSVAEPSEVLVSRTVRDLVAGAGFEFVDRGEHQLKGVPDAWRLYAVS